MGERAYLPIVAYTGGGTKSVRRVRVHNCHPMLKAYILDQRRSASSAQTLSRYLGDESRLRRQNSFRSSRSGKYGCSSKLLPRRWVKRQQSEEPDGPVNKVAIGNNAENVDQVSSSLPATINAKAGVRSQPMKQQGPQSVNTKLPVLPTNKPQGNTHTPNRIKSSTDVGKNSINSNITNTPHLPAKPTRPPYGPQRKCKTDPNRTPGVTGPFNDRNQPLSRLSSSAVQSKTCKAVSASNDNDKQTSKRTADKSETGGRLPESSSKANVVESGTTDVTSAIKGSASAEKTLVSLTGNEFREALNFYLYDNTSDVVDVDDVIEADDVTEADDEGKDNSKKDDNYAKLAAMATEDVAEEDVFECRNEYKKEILHLAQQLTDFKQQCKEEEDELQAELKEKTKELLQKREEIEKHLEALAIPITLEVVQRQTNLQQREKELVARDHDLTKKSEELLQQKESLTAFEDELKDTERYLYRWSERNKEKVESLQEEEQKLLTLITFLRDSKGTIEENSDINIDGEQVLGHEEQKDSEQEPSNGQVKRSEKDEQLKKLEESLSVLRSHYPVSETSTKAQSRWDLVRKSLEASKSVLNTNLQNAKAELSRNQLLLENSSKQIDSLENQLSKSDEVIKMKDEKIKMLESRLALFSVNESRTSLPGRGPSGDSVQLPRLGGSDTVINRINHARTMPNGSVSSGLDYDRRNGYQGAPTRASSYQLGLNKGLKVRDIGDGSMVMLTTAQHGKNGRNKKNGCKLM